jgi:hypothetical protein
MEVTNVAQTKIYLTWNSANILYNGVIIASLVFTPNRIIGDACMI